MMNGTGENVCKCSHHKAMSGLVILFGLLFLLGKMEVVGMQAVDYGWPLLVIAGGLWKMMGGKCKCC